MPEIKRKQPLIPYWQTTDEETVRLYQGDALETLRKLPSQSVHMIVTSPPYWGLRDYGTGTWEGGDPKCTHKYPIPKTGSTAQVIGEGYDRPFRGSTGRADHQEEPYLDKHGACRRCGARKVDHQLGSEKVPDCLGWAKGVNCAEKDWENGCHVCRMVLVFRELRRVLRDDGTFWLNYGDSYGGGGFQNDFSSSGLMKDGRKEESRLKTYEKGFKTIGVPNKPVKHQNNLASGNLVGIPWRVALALQADGWVLRQDIIWHKPSPMPESVRNRCTKAHEYVFLLTKGTDYFCDMEAIKEKAEYGYREMPENDFRSHCESRGSGTTGGKNDNPGAGRNKRSVWTEERERMLLGWLMSNHPEVATIWMNHVVDKPDVWKIASAGYPGAHFATFPPKLIEPMILAGTSAKGCCGECGAPWTRIVEEKQLTRERPNEYVKRTGEEGTGNSCSNTVAGVEVKTVGWQPSCKCNGYFVRRNEIRTYVSELPLEDHDVNPCIVLDPFMGAATSAIVSLDHGRNVIGIELSEKYLTQNAIPRIEGWFLSRPAYVGLIPEKVRKGK